LSPDTRQHRGPHPEDRKRFAPGWLPALQAATAELSWLLERGYPPTAALKLVGDRHRLDERQRRAVSRAACSDRSRERRGQTRLELTEAKGERLVLDGFNLIITVEAALSDGVLLRCRDGCLRDLSSVHGSYRSVQETDAAIELLGETLDALAPESVLWLLDQPISNSGRLAQRIRTAGDERGRPWEVETVFNPDTEILASDRVAATSDSTILDGVSRWIDVVSPVVLSRIPDAWVIDLREPLSG
jgi:hypothetical protein